MKQSLLIILIFSGICFSCTSSKITSSRIHENELINTRRYIGEFIDYRHTEPGVFGSDLIWIKTTLFNSFGKLSAYGTKCDFTQGDKIYLRRIYSVPDAFGNWTYQIENDSSVIYKVSGYKYENNVLVKAWF